MPGEDGLQLIRRIRRAYKHLPCIAMTGFGSIDSSVGALQAGAFWYLEKPFESDLGNLKMLVAQAARFREERLAAQRAEPRPEPVRPRREIIGKSPALLRVMERVDRVASSNATVLITGESGTGKELVARAIHERSARAQRPFVTVNCGAVPEELLESELFGHVRGAFTSAVAAREGRFSVAHGGTLFLDEIGDMSPSLQVKLLRVLQDGSFEAVGSSKTTHVEVRVIAATNQDLEQAIRERRFREDLFFRLNVVPVQVPPLRERREDIPLLANHFVARLERPDGSGAPSLTQAALERLTEYDWPGNVRELENLIERLAVLSSGPTIGVAELPAAFLGVPTSPSSLAPTIPPSGLPLQQVVSQIQDDLLLQALERTGWNKAQAARLLGLNRTTLLEMIKKRGLGERRRDR
jgi:DNA-binding NtrC family response regulator